MACSSSSHKLNEVHHAFSESELPGKRRKVEESVRLFDVFINHRGPDTKKILAEPLYKSLDRLGIRSFLDSQEKELGDLFESTIEKAIESAKVHIAIFSKGYAESPWCLNELVLMLKTEAKIIPLFYHVKPSALRFTETGEYDAAFNRYEEKNRYSTDKLMEWKDALRRASLITGYEINHSNTDYCKQIVLAVQKEMQKKKQIDIGKYPVGISKLVNNLERRCHLELLNDFESQYRMNEKGKGKARIVSIYGMGGTGKTTLSKALFNKYRWKYTRACFLHDVREVHGRRDLPSLQVKLLKDLFDECNHSFTSPGEGLSCLRERLGRIESVSFLIVLDDIGHLDQLDNLLVNDMVNKSGDSLIIITTRDEGLLSSAGLPIPYNLRGLDEEDARDLFCLHAFGQSNPIWGYELLVKKFVDICDGVPLSLQILGSDVKGRDQKYWRSALRKASKTLHQDIREKLKISFDSLQYEEKQIFMDIACFFIGNSKSMVIKVGEGSGWEVHAALERLKEKCLVQEIEKNHSDSELVQWEWDGTHLRMHDHLRDLGREMSDSPSCCRLWQPKDLKNLGSNEGFLKILCKTKTRCFHSFSDTTTGSQITYFVAESDDWGDTSASLLWLQLDLKSLVHRSVPSWIPLQKLQCLRICNGQLERLWESHQAPLQLKELQISNTTLKEVPDLGILDNLENVVLDAEHMPRQGWHLLESLRMNIFSLHVKSSTLEGKLASTNCEELIFESLIIRNFKQSAVVALNNSPMSHLENLEIGDQYSVTKILISGNHCPNLQTLKLHHMKNLIEIDLLRTETLKSLEVSHCENLKRVSGISDLTYLVELNIFQSPELDGDLRLRNLYCLERITVDRCGKLKCLELNNCKSLRTVSGMEDLEELAILNIRDCPELLQLSAHNLSCRQRITIDGCEKLNCHAFYSLLNFKILTFDIGRAVVEAESILNQSLFSESPIGVDSVTEMDIPCPAIPQALVSKIIICGLVVVKRSTPQQFINYRTQEFHLKKGRWMVTMVISDPKTNCSYIKAAVEAMCYGMLEKGFRVTLVKGQEGETFHVLKIIDKLYEK